MENNHSLTDAVVVVTGGAGFIGSHLVSRLCYEGVRKIVIIDSLKYGTPRNLISDPRIQIIQSEIGKGPLTPEIVEVFKDADYLFHLAAEKHNQSINEPNWVLESNVIGTYSLYELAAQSGVKKVIFSSSLYAYGRVTAPAFAETEIPVPDTTYGISKVAGENLLRYAHKKYGILYTALRLFFVYGPKQFPGMGYKSVIIKNFERIKNDQNPVVFGDGEQALDYIYVDDVVEYLVRSLGSICDNETINVCSGTPVSINALTDVMIRISGKKLEKEYQPKDSTFDTSRVGSPEKMKTVFSDNLQTSLESGLEKTYEWVINQT